MSWKFVVLWTFLVTSFLILGAALLFFANGYRINLKARKLIKTGLVKIISDPRETFIYLNGRYIANGTPKRISYLLPGRYDLRVEKDRYWTWEKTIEVESGLVNVRDSISLFLKNPEIEIVPNQIAATLLAQLEKTNNNEPEIVVQSGEIWIGERLVTRFSEQVFGVKWYSDHRHIIFQIGKGKLFRNNEIRVMDLDGSNNFLLVKLEQATSTNFWSLDRERLFYQDGLAYKIAKIK